MLDVNNSKLLADVLLAGLVILVVIAVYKHRKQNKTAFILSILALVTMLALLTVDLTLSSSVVSTASTNSINEQTLFSQIFNLRPVLTAVMAGLLICALLCLEYPRQVTTVAMSEQKRTLDEKDRPEPLVLVRENQRHQVLGALSSHIAHQLQNRAAIMLSHVEVVKSKLDNESPLQKNIEGIRHSLLISSQLMHRMVAFRDSHTKSLAPVNIVPPLKQIAPLLTEITPSCVELDLSFPDNGLTIVADIADLQLALVCLVSDALTAIENSSGDIQVSVFAPGDEFTVLKVHSSGYLTLADIGDDSLSHARLQVGDSSQASRGSQLSHHSEDSQPSRVQGAGFTTAEQIVTRHGGHIDVASSPDSGTTVSLYFPRKISA